MMGRDDIHLHDFGPPGCSPETPAFCSGCGTLLNVWFGISCKACWQAGGVNMVRRWAVATARQERIEMALA